MTQIIGRWDNSKLALRKVATHPIISDYSNQRIRLISKYLPPDGDLLELGSGDGYFSINLSSKFNILSSDQSAEMLARNPVRNKKVLNACLLPFPDNSF
jgi:ubiquinone/menaquinone biosynthesis C-methylase UbiE